MVTFLIEIGRVAWKTRYWADADANARSGQRSDDSRSDRSSSQDV
jgi:hypothetical protein